MSCQSWPSVGPYIPENYVTWTGGGAVLARCLFALHQCVFGVHVSFPPGQVDPCSEGRSTSVEVASVARAPRSLRVRPVFGPVRAVVMSEWCVS